MHIYYELVCICILRVVCIVLSMHTSGTRVVLKYIHTWCTLLGSIGLRYRYRFDMYMYRSVYFISRKDLPAGMYSLVVCHHTVYMTYFLLFPITHQQQNNM